MTRKYLNKKDECSHPEWRPHGNGQYICKYCGKTTTMSATKVFKILKNIVNLIHGYNAKFIIDDYITESADGMRDFKRAPVHEVIPRRIKWKEFYKIKKKLKESVNTVLIFCLDEHYTEAELVIYEVPPSV